MLYLGTHSVGAVVDTLVVSVAGACTGRSMSFIIISYKELLCPKELRNFVLS